MANPFDQHVTRWTVKNLKTGKTTRHDTMEEAHIIASHLIENKQSANIIPPKYRN